MGGGALERLIPGSVTIALFDEHAVRYQFAGGFVRDKRVLDMACGCGIGSYHLLRMGARSCTGIDISPDAISYSQGHYPGPRFALGDALNLPLEDESVDVVVSFETIEHVRNTAKFVDECCRVLAPGGLFIGSTPHDPVYHWLDPEDNPFHLHRFSAKQLAAILSSRFENVQLYAQSLMRYPTLIAKQLCERFLHVVGLADPVLRALGKLDPGSLSTASEFKLQCGDNPIRPYRASFMWQPKLVIATATKSAATEQD